MQSLASIWMFVKDATRCSVGGPAQGSNLSLPVQTEFGTGIAPMPFASGVLTLHTELN